MEFRRDRCEAVFLFSLEQICGKDYQVPFAFTGKLGKITVDLGESSISPEAIKVMMEELAQKRDR